MAHLTNEQEIGNLIARMRHAVDRDDVPSDVRNLVEKEMNHLQDKLYEGHFSPFSKR